VFEILKVIWQKLSKIIVTYNNSDALRIYIYIYIYIYYLYYYI